MRKEDFTDDGSQTTFEGFPPSPVPSHTDCRVAAAGEEDDDCLRRLVLAQRSRSDWLLVPSLCLVCYQACCWALMRTYRRPKLRGREVAVWLHAPSPIYLSIVSCIVVASLSCYFRGIYFRGIVSVSLRDQIRGSVQERSLQRRNAVMDCSADRSPGTTSA